MTAGPDPWRPLDDAIVAAAAAGRTLDVWLRDDDAVTRTPALDRFAALSHRFAAPVLLAVIPAQADAALASFVADHPLLTPAQHGWSHANHAAEGERACELGGARPLAAVCDDLALGRATMQALFGPAAADVLVPPWNRMAPALLPHLPALGFGALSTFAGAHADATGLAVVNCDLDIVDWRRGRSGRPADQLARRLAALVAEAPSVGILTHHLAHDAAAWHGLEACLTCLGRHANIRYVPFDTLRTATTPGRPRAGPRSDG